MLGQVSPSETTKNAQLDLAYAPPFLEEQPWGTFLGLKPGGEYYVYVEEDPAREAIERAVMEAQWTKLGEQRTAFEQEMRLKYPEAEKPQGPFADDDTKYAEFAGHCDVWGGHEEEPEDGADGGAGALSAGSGMAESGGIFSGGWK